MAKTITLGLIEEMVANYKTKQYQSIITNTVNPMTVDAQSVWFDLEELKRFITAIEEETSKHPEYMMKNFGVRFYYSAYPNGATWNDTGHEELATLDPSYGKLHTLIAIPTADINGNNSDFDPYDVNTYTGNKPTGKSTAIMAENHGDLTPPNPAVGLWF